MIEPLQIVESSAVALETAYRDCAPSRTMLAALAEHVELIRAVRVITPLRRRPPSFVAHPVAIDPDLEHNTRCPRCLGWTDWAHVEQHGVCIDCALSGHGRRKEPAPVAAGAETIDAPAPPGAGGVEAAVVAPGAGAVITLVR